MEERQIADFVSRLYDDEELRNELKNDPETLIEREGFSSRVARVVMQLVPNLTVVQMMEKPSLPSWGSWP